MAVGKIIDCKHCKNKTASFNCLVCGNQKHIRVNACGRQCEEYGHGASDCELWVPDKELEEHLKHRELLEKQVHQSMHLPYKYL